MKKALFAAVIAAAAFAQSPVFDAADVHPSASGANLYMSGGTLARERYVVHSASLLDLIRTAYGIDDRSMTGDDDNRRIVGGPSWLALDRFEVIAKAPAGTPPETLKLMLRTLLAQRFQLVVHPDTRPLPGFELVTGKGRPKMKEADTSAPAGCKSQPGSPPFFQYACRNVTMDAFAAQLRRMSYALNNPVADHTGLTGAWDFDLRWGGQEISIFDAIDQQIGLKLEPARLDRPVIVVDSVNRKPSANAPDIAAHLPLPPPARFEVAEIKPSAPGANPRRRNQPGGRIDWQSQTLRVLIRTAWNIGNDDLLAGAPKFIDSARFDITARASVSADGPASPPTDFEDIRVMLKNLLIDRFKLSAHMEDRPVNAYKLTAGKPKLQKADAAGRTECKEGPGADGKDPRVASPWLARLVSCQNVTMAQFAEQIPYFAGVEVNAPVADATRIKGSFDLTLSFSPPGLVQAANQQAAAGAPASDPSGVLSLSDALARQLGLKLETDKRALPVLVIDHIEENPAGD